MQGVEVHLISPLNHIQLQHTIWMRTCSWCFLVTIVHFTELQTDHLATLVHTSLININSSSAIEENICAAVLL